MQRQIVAHELRIAMLEHVPTTTTTKNTQSTTVGVVALHGWLDNCATFAELAPQLTSVLNWHIFCIDMPGYGKSQHKQVYIFFYWYLFKEFDICAQ